MSRSNQRQSNTTAHVLIASLVGTTIEFFDFYIYATAAVLVFPKLFFPASDPVSATLQSLATFAIAFFARPIGAALFGHFGDRIGRKATLVAALMTMGPSTVAIGLLPTYDSIGFWAPLLLALFRFGQGLGLGGEWGGAVLLATENAPAGKTSWFGMFPQLGAPLGFILSSGTFLILTNTLSNQDFLDWGWRIPFVASALLVFIGLYVRLKLSETPKFMEVIEKNQQVKVPLAEIFTRHARVLMVGTFMAINTFILFYLMTVFTLGWGTSVLHYSRSEFLIAQLIGVLFFGLGVIISGSLADRVGKGKMLLGASLFSMLFGLILPSLFIPGDFFRVACFLSLGLLIMGFTYGPLGAALAEIFPAKIRYTGASTAFTLAGILGASLAPYIATYLAQSRGLEWVGYYLSLASLISLVAFYRMTFSAGKLGRE